MNNRFARHLSPRLVGASAAAIAVMAGTATVAAGAAAIPRGIRTTSAPWPGFAMQAGARHWVSNTGVHRPAAADTEYFHVVSGNSSGPGSIVVTGVVNAGGVEHPGRAIDTARFAGGSLRIDHSAGRPTVRFNTATCVGTITQRGPFTVIDATGEMAVLAGHGTYSFKALYTTSRLAGHCTHAVTGYVETINGMATVKG